MAHAVRFRTFGGPEVLEVTEIPIPEPGDGEVLVEVFAAGISPVESAVRGGANADCWPVEFPSGQGREFAGVVVRSGPGATRFRPGAEVMGYLARGPQATHVVVPEAQLMGFLDFLGGGADEATALGVPASRVFTTTDREAVEDREAVDGRARLLRTGSIPTVGEPTGAPTR